MQCLVDRAACAVCSEALSDLAGSSQGVAVASRSFYARRLRIPFGAEPLALPFSELTVQISGCLFVCFVGLFRRFEVAYVVTLSVFLDVY